MKILRKIVCSKESNSFTNTFDFCIDGERNYEGVHYYVVRDVDGKYFEIGDATELSKQIGYRVEIHDDSTLWVVAPKRDEDYLAEKLSLLSTDSILSSESFEDHEDEELNQYEDRYLDDIQEINQEFTSENTSINSRRLPAIFRMVSFEPGTINLDMGGGKFDNVADYLSAYDVINLVYDPYNRSKKHNNQVVKTIKGAGGADTATCSNVLNVIKEPEARLNVLTNMSKLVKPDGDIYITVYEGSGTGNEGPTKSGYQLNRKTADYLEEVQQVFPDAKRKGKLIIAHNSTSVSSALQVKCNRKLMRIKSINSATDLDNLQQIQSELNEKLHEVMTELPFGFLPEEVDEYSVVEVTEGQNMIKAEVRAELNYDELSELCEFLDPVVQKYDTNTYFEPVEPGIIEAYIHMNEEITSSTDITSSEDIDRTSEDLLANDAKFRYQMLGRMQQDCNYFLDYRDPKFLWAGDVNDQIRLMRDLYNSFSDDEKPEWISMDDIDELERAMTDKHT